MKTSKSTNSLRWIEANVAQEPAILTKFLPLPGGLEPLGKRRKESAEGGGPERAERAGASESLGRGEGERKHITIRWQTLSHIPKKTRATYGMTLLEIMVVCAVIAMLAAIVLLGSLQKPKRRSPRIQCVNNLKQIGLATRVWEGDNNDKYPPQVPATNGGSMDYITSTNVWRHFQVVSNELSTPKVLMCPADADRPLAATNFTWLNNSNISFFFGIDASETNAQMFLSGDRNITNGTPVRNGILTLTTAKPAGWTKEMHKKAGNIALADGSVQQLSISGLQSAVTKTGFPTNRLQMPILGP